MWGHYPVYKPRSRSRQLDVVVGPRPMEWTCTPHPAILQMYEKGLWSVILQKWIRVKVSACALREIDRKGGLDEYILLSSDDQLGGEGSVGVLLKHGLQAALKERNEIHAAQTNEVEVGKETEASPVRLQWREALHEQFWKDHQATPSPSASSEMEKEQSESERKDAESQQAAAVS